MLSDLVLDKVSFLAYRGLPCPHIDFPLSKAFLLGYWSYGIRTSTLLPLTLSPKDPIAKYSHIEVRASSYGFFFLGGGGFHNSVHSTYILALESKIAGNSNTPGM